jgi:endonuclease YncB( thermonuclease family)
MGGLCSCEESTATKKPEPQPAAGAAAAQPQPQPNVQPQEPTAADDGDDDNSVDDGDDGGHRERGLRGGPKPQPRRNGGNSNNNPPAAAATAAAGGVRTHTKPLAQLKQLRESVHHVYDGDTLTLNDESGSGQGKRVRLLGIDAPEVKEADAFATESKALLAKLVPKKAKVIIEVDPANAEDHYGRVVGRVFVIQQQRSDAPMVCANDEMLLAGLATFYNPKSGAQMCDELKTHMLALQRDAMAHRRGIWSDFHDEPVFKTTNGNAFHKKSCEHLKGRPAQLPKSDAIAGGLSACRTCF